MAIAPNTKEFKDLQEGLEQYRQATADEGYGELTKEEEDYYLESQNVDSRLFRMAEEDAAKEKTVIEKPKIKASQTGDIVFEDSATDLLIGAIPGALKEFADAGIYGIGKVAELASTIGGDIVETLGSSQSQLAALEQLQGSLYAVEKDKEQSDKLIDKALNIEAHNKVGKNVRNGISRFVDDIDVKLSQTDVGRTALNYLKQAADPEETTIGQDVVGVGVQTLPLFMMGKAMVAKEIARKGLPLAARIGGFMKDGAKLAIAENLLTTADEETLAQTVGETIRAAAEEEGVPLEEGDYGVFTALVTNPDDPALVRRGKQMVDSLILAGGLNTLLKIPGVSASLGKYTKEQINELSSYPEGRGVLNAAVMAGIVGSFNPIVQKKELIDAGAGDIPEGDETSDLIDINIINEPNRPVMQAGIGMDILSGIKNLPGKTGDILKKVNFNLARSLKSQAGLPPELYEKYLEMQNGLKGLEISLEQDIKQIDKIIEGGVPERVVNAFMTGRLTREQMEQYVPAESLEQLAQLRNKIDSQTDEISKLLELDTEKAKTILFERNKIINKYKLPESISNKLLDGESLDDLSADELKLIPDEAKEEIKNQGQFNKLAVVFERGKGGYLTQTYQVYTNPKWSRNLTKALKGKRDSSGNLLVDPAKPNSIKTAKIINNARDWLKTLPGNEKLDEAQIDSLLEEIINKGDKDNILDSITDIIGGQMGSDAAKILKERKDLDKPLAELLGRTNSVTARYAATMRNQRDLINRASYLQEIKNIAEQTTGTRGIINKYNIPPQIASQLLKGIKVNKLTDEELSLLPQEAIDELMQPPATLPLEGFFPGLKQEAQILRRQEGDVTNNLNELEKKFLGTFGGDSNIGLDQFVVSDELYKALENGSNTFQNFRFINNPWINKAAGYTQATETIFDTGAYGVNAVGSLQQLLFNGHINPKSAIAGVRTMATKLKGGDPKTIRLLDKMKSRGVLDSQVATANIAENINLVNKKEYADITDSEGFLGLWDKTKDMTGQGIKTAFDTPSRLYGFTDDLSKMIAVDSEINRYRSALKPFDDVINSFNLSDDIAKKLRKGEDLTEAELNSLPQEALEQIDIAQDELENFALERVRNTMPSYTTASPIIRNIISRVPLGTYATFPAEVIRTQFNIVKYGLDDMRQGIATGNPQLIRAGMARLGGLAGTATGIEMYTNNNNTDLGITNTNQRAITMMQPEWAKGSSQYHHAPFTVDPDTGNVIAKFSNLGFVDASQTVKGPLKQIIGRALAGDIMTESELQEQAMIALRELTGAFLSPKAYVETIGQVGFGVDENGRPVYSGSSERFWEDFSTAAEKVWLLASPGLVDNAMKIAEAEQAASFAESKGQKIPRSRSGFPNLPEEQWLRLVGLNGKTQDITMGVGKSLYDKRNAIKNENNILQNKLRSLDPRAEWTQEDIDAIKEEINKHRSNVTKQQRRLADSVRIFENITYFDKDNKPQQYGKVGIYKSLMRPEFLDFQVPKNEIAQTFGNKVPPVMNKDAARGLYFNLINKKGLPQEEAKAIFNYLITPILIEPPTQGQFDVITEEEQQ